MPAAGFVSKQQEPVHGLAAGTEETGDLQQYVAMDPALELIRRPRPAAPELR
jgi:hypothetical protein